MRVLALLTVLALLLGCGDPSRNPYLPKSLRISGTVVWPDCSPASEAIVRFYAADCTGFVFDACPQVMSKEVHTRANGSYLIEVTLDNCRLDLHLWAHSPPGSSDFARANSVALTCEAEQEFDFVLGESEHCDPSGAPSDDWR